jgi:hypothetical protein
MKTIYFSGLMILTIILVSMSLRTNAAKDVSHNYTDTAKMEGIVVHAGNFSQRVAILMRDTTLSGNRFDYRWHKGTDQNGRIS